MVAIDTVDNRASVTFSGILSLGLVFFWSMLGWNSTPLAFGIEVEKGSLYPIVVQTAIVAALVILSFWGNVQSAAASPDADSRDGVPSRKTIAAPLTLGAACAIGSVLATIWLPFVGGALLGAAQGLFLAAWVGVYRAGLLRTLLMLFGASTLAYVSSLAITDRIGVGVLALSLVLPPIAALIMWQFRDRAERSGRFDPARGSAPGPSPDNPLLGGAFLLCCFASGVVSFNAPVGIGSGAPLMAVASFTCVALLMLVGLPQLEIPFALLSLAICVLMGCTLAFDQVPGFLVNCIYAGYWILFLGALGWLARPPATYRYCLRGWAAVYFVTMMANLLSFVVPRNIGCVVALVLMAAVFAAAFIKTSLSHKPQASATPATPFAPAAEENPGRIEAIAREAGLTETEGEVFTLLAKGFPLKPIAAQLHISESTAKYHRHNIYQKLGIASREELIALVHREG